MSHPLLIAWYDATFRPRSGLPRQIDLGWRGMILVFPITGGILQSLLQASSASVGIQLSVPVILGWSALIGSAWGILQLHIVAGAVWAVARDGADRIPFRDVRHVAALSMAPTTYAFLAWLLASVLVGRLAFIDLALLVPEAIEPSVVMQMGLLYLGTGLCFLWSVVVLVLGVRKLEGGTLGESIVTVILSGLITLAAVFAIVILVVATVLVLR